MGGWRGVGDNLTDGFFDWIISRLLVVYFSVFSVSFFFFFLNWLSQRWVGRLHHIVGLHNTALARRMLSQPAIVVLSTDYQKMLFETISAFNAEPSAEHCREAVHQLLIDHVCKPIVVATSAIWMSLQEVFPSDETRIKGMSKMEENQGSIPGIK